MLTSKLSGLLSYHVAALGVPRDYVRYNLTPKISSLAVRSLACELRFYGVRGVEIFIVLQHAPLEAKELTYKCTYLL